MDKFFTQLALSDQRNYRLGRHLLFWTACWLFQGFLYGFLYMNGQPVLLFQISLTESLFFLPQHMLLSYGIMYIALPRYILKDHYWQGITLVLLLVLLSAVLSPVVNEFLINPYRDAINVPRKGNSLFFSFMGGLRGSMTV